MRSKKMEERKALLKLTKKQRSILVGTLLGDGHLETQTKGHTYRLKIEHTIKQAFYVDWLYKQFLEWTISPPKNKFKVVNDSEYENYYFQTMSVGQLRFYAKQFYDNRRKVIPDKIGHWLTPLALAVWFMDDGSSKSKQHKAIILNTQGFKRKDIELLRRALVDKYAIETAFRIQKDGLQLIIVGDNAKLFYKLVWPYLLPGFEYKFGALVNTLPKKYRRRSKVG